MLKNKFMMTAASSQLTQVAEVPAVREQMYADVCREKSSVHLSYTEISTDVCPLKTSTVRKREHGWEAKTMRH
jgi:hypothetical protein